MPDPIDPNKSMGEFLFGSDWETGQGITDPEFQRRLIDAEREFSPEYVQNELTRQNIALFGSDDQPGLLALYEQAAPITERMRAQTASAQRESDIADVERYGGRAIDALRAADPERARLLEQQQALTDDLYARAQGVTPPCWQSQGVLRRRCLTTSKPHEAQWELLRKALPRCLTRTPD